MLIKFIKFIPHFTVAPPVFFILLWSTKVFAGGADIIAVDTECSGNLCRFQVTVRHEDEGWDHYADAILVLSRDGDLLGSRPLRHPHTGQASFTRMVQALIPEGMSRVIIRAHDSVHGLDGKDISVELPF